MRRTLGHSARTALLVILAGCYSYTPMESGAPPIGHTFGFVISDRGRVGLSDRLGPGVSRIEARLIGQDQGQFVVEVFRVAQIGGTSSQWSGETMRLDRDFVGLIEDRRLSKKRTALLAVGAASAMAVLIATKGLMGFSREEEPRPPGPPPASRLAPATPTP